MKKISRRSFLIATGVIAASAALSACAGSSASTSSAGSTAASTAASGSAAQGGGDLVIYSPNSEGLLNATIPLFEEKYGVNVVGVRQGEEVNVTWDPHEPLPAEGVLIIIGSNEVLERFEAKR